MNTYQIVEVDLYPLLKQLRIYWQTNFSWLHPRVAPNLHLSDTSIKENEVVNIWQCKIDTKYTPERHQTIHQHPSPLVGNDHIGLRTSNSLNDFGQRGSSYFYYHPPTKDCIKFNILVPPPLPPTANLYEECWGT